MERKNMSFERRFTGSNDEEPFSIGFNMPDQQPPEEEQKVPYCEPCNNSTDFKVRGKVTICAKCGRFASKWLESDVEGLQEAIRQNWWGLL